MRYLGLRVDDAIHKSLSKEAGPGRLQSLAVRILESHVTKRPPAPDLLSGLTQSQCELVGDLIWLIDHSPKVERVLQAIVELARGRR